VFQFVVNYERSRKQISVLPVAASKKSKNCSRNFSFEIVFLHHIMS